MSGILRPFLRAGHGRISRTGLILLVLAALAIAAPPFLTPNSYTNLYLSDALYLLNAGYLVAHGHIPHLGFGWQFGGYEAGLIALAMSLTGVTVRALDHAIAIGFLVNAALLLIGTARHVRPLTLGLLLLLVTAASLTRYPFESGPPDIAVQSYAMFYNRACWCLLIAIFAPLLLAEGPLRWWEVGAVAIATLLIVVTKITFALPLPLAAALLWRHNGWRGIGLAALWIAAAAVGAWVAFGFGPGAYLRLLPDMLDATQDLLSVTFGPLSKLANIVFFQAGSLLALFAALAWIAVRARHERGILVTLGALTLLLGLSLALTVSTGSFYALTATTPMLAFVAVALVEVLLRRTSEPGRLVGVAALSLFALAFTGPYLANYLLGMAKQATRGEQSIFGPGPLAGLIVDQSDDNRSPAFRDVADANAYIARRNALEGGIGWMHDYEWQYLIKDGVDIVRQQPDAARLRIAAFYPSIFPFAAGAAPVTSFPLYPGFTSPSMRRLVTLPRDVNTVMILRSDPANRSAARFRPAMLREYRLAARSVFWDLYRRADGAR
jgi:hypothetical protein